MVLRRLKRSQKCWWNKNVPKTSRLRTSPGETSSFINSFNNSFIHSFVHAFTHNKSIFFRIYLVSFRLVVDEYLSCNDKNT